MTHQIESANLFKSLHCKSDPLILFNIWDVGSAKAIQASGAKAIATSSWAVAAAHGYEDGEKLPFDLVIANLKRIVANVDLPVSLDFEGGYAQTLNELQNNISAIIKAGAIGINFEDQIVDTKELHSVTDQCERINAIRITAEQMSIPFFINARSDVFFKMDPVNHNEDHLKEALDRVSAYAAAGANGFFVPGLINTHYIKKLCELSPISINVMMNSNISVGQLLTLGVSRISYGPAPYCQLMDSLKEAGNKALFIKHQEN